MRFLQGIATGTPFSFTLLFSRDFCLASKVGKVYMSIVWYTELKGEVFQVEAMVNRSVLSRLLLLSIRWFCPLTVARIHTHAHTSTNAWKESKESEGYETEANEHGGERGKENGRRTSFGRREVWRDQAKPGQARPEARLWLRDHLGRQAWNAAETRRARGWADRRGNHRKAKREREKRGPQEDQCWGR